MKKITFITMLSVLGGTILEWYDFSLLALMAPIISNLFFPTESPLLSLLAIFSVFASGHLMRPFGGIIFGHIGDRYGRKNALSTTIILMAVPTTLIGLLPTFSTMGLVSAILLVFLRLIQGIASSGEYPGAICFLTEIAPQDKRGLWGSLSMFGVVGGVLLGSITNFIITTTLSADQLTTWGWRLPFLIGLPLGIIGWFLRYKTNESEIFILAKSKNKILKLPLKEIVKFNFTNLVNVIVLFSMSTVTFYISFVYVITYLVSVRKITFHDALINNVFSIIVLIFLIPVFGYMSDKHNRKWIMFAGAFCLLTFVYPIFILFLENQNTLLLGQFLSAIFLAMFVGPMAATVSEIFPTFTRFSGVSVGLNVGASIFGGTCPLIATYLVQYSGNEKMPVIYIVFLALLCLFSINSLRINQNLPLNEI